MDFSLPIFHFAGYVDMFRVTAEANDERSTFRNSIFSFFH